LWGAICCIVKVKIKLCPTYSFNKGFIMKLIMVLVVILAVFTLTAPEPNLAGMTPSSPFERCMVLHGDTDTEKECDYLKLIGE